MPEPVNPVKSVNPVKPVEPVARFIRYGMCRCYVWPLDPRLPAGRCRRCGDRPFAIFDDEDDCLDAFHREYGRSPQSFEEFWG